MLTQILYNLRSQTSPALGVSLRTWKQGHRSFLLIFTPTASEENFEVDGQLPWTKEGTSLVYNVCKV